LPVCQVPSWTAQLHRPACPEHTCMFVISAIVKEASAPCFPSLVHSLTRDTVSEFVQ
jgi:hypothetical protein